MKNIIPIFLTAIFLLTFSSCKNSSQKESDTVIRKVDSVVDKANSEIEKMDSATNEVSKKVEKAIKKKYSWRSGNQLMTRSGNSES